MATPSAAESNKPITQRMHLLLTGSITLLVLAIAFTIAWKTLSGRGLRMQTVHRIRAVLQEGAVESNGDFTNVIFLHHSVGRYIINQGRVRQRMTAAGFEFWDHDYNWEGLIAPDATRTGYSYVIPDDNTNPDGLARLFAQPVRRRPFNAFSGLMQHEVIAFKSCFPTSDIADDAQLEQYKIWYLGMRDVMDQHPDRIFIVVTPPPLNPAATNAENAARARTFADWLTSDQFLGGHPNVFTFDLFDQLAEDDPLAADANMLRADYREGDDSHPNELANQTVGPFFADFIVESVQSYRSHLAQGGD